MFYIHNMKRSKKAETNKKGQNRLVFFKIQVTSKISYRKHYARSQNANTSGITHSSSKN